MPVLPSPALFEYRQETINKNPEWPVTQEPLKSLLLLHTRNSPVNDKCCQKNGGGCMPPPSFFQVADRLHSLIYVASSSKVSVIVFR